MGGQGYGKAWAGLDRVGVELWHSRIGLGQSLDRGGQG